MLMAGDTRRHSRAPGPRLDRPADLGTHDRIGRRRPRRGIITRGGGAPV